MVVVVARTVTAETRITWLFKFKLKGSPKRGGVLGVIVDKGWAFILIV